MNGPIQRTSCTQASASCPRTRASRLELVLSAVGGETLMRGLATLPAKASVALRLTGDDYYTPTAVGCKRRVRYPTAPRWSPAFRRKIPAKARTLTPRRCEIVPQCINVSRLAIVHTKKR